MRENSRMESSPEIVSFKWGEIRVKFKGVDYVYKDCKIFPSGSVEWDWNLTGTRHLPGIQLADLESIKELNNKKCVVVLSTGMDGVLQITPQLIEYLKENKIEYSIEKTPEAIRIYNKLVSYDRMVIGLFHSTC